MKSTLLACLPWLLAPVGAPAAEGRTNVLLIMVDDMGWMDLRCQGNERLDTPRLDAFARSGMRFTDAYAASPVCSPTRAALITGLAPARVGVTQHGPNDDRFGPEDKRIREAETSGALPMDCTTLADRLKARGYATAFFGKWHLSDTHTRTSKGMDDPAYWPDKRGFDLNFGGFGRGGPPTYFDPYRIPTIPDRKPGEYLTYRLAEETNAWMKAHAGKPFFICLWTFNVHYPFEAPPELVKKYQPRLGRGLINATYGGQVEATDIGVGRVLEQLEKLGLADDTLVIFTSDNGGWTGATDNRPLREGKGHLYEGGLRVPLAIRWPGVTKPGSESAVPVVTMDLAATILDATSTTLPVDQPLDGETLRPVLAGTGGLKREALCFHYPHWAFHGSNRPGGAIRRGDDKLIEFFDGTAPELYDLADDPGEARNVAADRPELAKQLLDELRRWRKEVGAKMPTPVR